MKKLTLLLTLLMSLASFAQKPGFIPGPSPQLWSGPDCLANGAGAYEAFALGDRRISDGAVIDESPNHLEFNAPVVWAYCVLTTQYAMTYAHNVQGVILHMGSGKDAIQEWAFWVDIYKPDGTQYRLRIQFDKHTDYRGSMDEYFPVSWSLPAGSLIVIRRPGVICVSDPSPWGCITGESVTLVGK